MKPKKVLYILLSSFSAKLSMWLGMFVAMLFLATFSLMFYYAREAVREESLGKAEDVLDKFEITIGNTLHEKEVIAKQAHWTIEQCLDDPREVEHHVLHVLDNMPDIIGVAAAFEPGTYPDQQGDFMIYYHRNRGKIVKSNQFAGESYMHQPWYDETKQKDSDYWSDPKEDYRTDGEPIISYAIPLKMKGKTVGVFAIDISLYWLTRTVDSKRPSSTMYGSMVTKNGAFIIHPDTTLLKPRAMFRMMDMFPENQYSYLAYKMLGGERGHALIDFRGNTSFVVYKPYGDTEWAINIVCPEEEIMGHYNHLISLMGVIVFVAILTIVAFCFFFIHRQLNPLRVLERSAKRMKRGHYNSIVAQSWRKDEVGSLTNSFAAMQLSIKKHLSQIDQQKEQLNQQNKALNEANDHIMEAERIKIAFLQNMTDQMNEPVMEISKMVNTLAAHHQEMEHEQIVEMSNQMDATSRIITNLLERVLEVSTQKQEEKS